MISLRTRVSSLGVRSLYSVRRASTYYNTSIAGLTDEEMEVRLAHRCQHYPILTVTTSSETQHTRLPKKKSRPKQPKSTSPTQHPW